MGKKKQRVDKPSEAGVSTPAAAAPIPGAVVDCNGEPVMQLLSSEATRERSERIKRKVYERKIGRQYKAWLAEAAQVQPGTTTHDKTISIIVPVYNPPVRFLSECLESVVAQQARNWQLVVANDGSTKSEVADYLAEFGRQHEDDPRIVIVTKANGGISSALNAALERATAFGRWRAADVRSILAAGTGVPTPRPAGDALVIDLPTSTGRSLAEYAPATKAVSS